MKTSSFVSTLVLTLCLGLSGPIMLRAAEAEPDKETALYLRLHAKDLLDQVVKVDVVAVRPTHAQPFAGTFQIFQVLTQDKRNDRFGGEILVVVPEAQADALVKRYGVYPERPRRNPTTKSMSATLRETKFNMVYLDLDGTAAETVKNRHLPDMGGRGPGHLGR